MPPLTPADLEVPRTPRQANALKERLLELLPDRLVLETTLGSVTFVAHKTVPCGYAAVDPLGCTGEVFFPDNYRWYPRRLTRPDSWSSEDEDRVLGAVVAAWQDAEPARSMLQVVGRLRGLHSRVVNGGFDEDTSFAEIHAPVEPAVRRLFLAVAVERFVVAELRPQARIAAPTWAGTVEEFVAAHTPGAPTR
ncbi:hypothetical protein [Cellulomonas composti]|uniref:Uncharacterized protein n=1 Tax=Cellulomonas composti TaxID=266130 RepID=A0A511JA54_9CELL|nr:hypothetical protein [Cellulomonas composti]GEL94649.1 hypothetical protein CCO02nite_13070 [Cellulomonas composti]